MCRKLAQRLLGLVLQALERLRVPEGGVDPVDRDVGTDSDYGKPTHLIERRENGESQRPAIRNG